MKTSHLVIAFSILLSSGCRNTTVKTVTPEIPAVRTAKVISATISIPIHSSGVLVSDEEMKLSFKTGGIVSKIPVKEGDRVKKGDTLATLNLSEIKGQESLARNGYEKAVRDYTRAKNLYTDSVATLEQMQNAATAMHLAESNLNIVLFNLTHSTITAPENGIILKQFVRPNELVAPGSPVFYFGTSGGKWKVKTGLSDRDIVKINKGDSGIVTVDTWPGIKFPGVVSQVGEISDPLTGTYATELTLSSTAYRLATGFIAEVDLFPARKENFNMIPVEALVEADGKEGYVYVLSDSSTVRKLKVEIITIIGSKAAIRGDLERIREVVSEGAPYLKEGDKVKIAK
jgi:multidrug efflux system membrane fusion protein